MNRPFSLLVFAAALGVAQTACTPDAGQIAADLVIHGARVLTLDETNPEAEAVAVAGNKVLAVGSIEEMSPLIGGDTRVIELEPENLVLPGLIDGHGHYMSLGESLMQLDLRSPRSWDEIVELVGEAADAAEPGEWIVGRGWHQDKWDSLPVSAVEGLPVHASLSAVSPDHPVMLIHVSGHGVFVNGRALEVLGVSAQTQDPEGGEFVRDGDGNPTGMLRENAQELARAAVAEWKNSRPPAEIEAQLRRQVELAGANALENGITEFHDMGATFETIDFFKALAEEGSLPLRLYVHVEEAAERMEGRLDDYRMIGHGNGFLTVRGIGEKVLDGALGVHGGWLLEPYADMPRTSGFNVTPVADIQRSAASCSTFTRGCSRPTQTWRTFAGASSTARSSIRMTCLVSRSWALLRPCEAFSRPPTVRGSPPGSVRNGPGSGATPISPSSKLAPRS